MCKHTTKHEYDPNTERVVCLRKTHQRVVDKATYPALFEALSDICLDNGAGSRIQANVIVAPPGYNLAGIDRALFELLPMERAEFAIGDDEIQKEIAGRSPQLAAANRLFCEFFDEL
jgi:hypothetical protein